MVLKSLNARTESPQNDSESPHCRGALVAIPAFFITLKKLPITCPDLKNLWLGISRQAVTEPLFGTSTTATVKKHKETVDLQSLFSARIKLNSWYDRSSGILILFCILFNPPPSCFTKQSKWASSQTRGEGSRRELPHELSVRRTEIGDLDGYGSVHGLKALLEHYPQGRGTGSLPQTWCCPTAGRKGRYFWHISYCHAATLRPSHSPAVTEVLNRAITHPISSLGRALRATPVTQRNGSMFYISVNRLDTKSSYLVRRLLWGDEQGRAATRQRSPLRDQQEGRLRKESWSYEGRNRGHLCPTGSYPLIPSPPGILTKWMWTGNWPEGTF